MQFPDFLLFFFLFTFLRICWLLPVFYYYNGD